MNEVQSKLLEIAVEFIKVCEKLKLNYFASGGTVLGAARHNGFIPWDDDMDFQMPRKDYEIFIKYGQQYLPEYLFLQTNKTEKYCYSTYARIRDSNTAAIPKHDLKAKFNQGIWIDIFPLDKLPKDLNKVKKIHYIDEHILKRRFIPSRYVGDSKKGDIANFLVKICLPSKRLALKISQHYTLKYENLVDYDYVWNSGANRFKFHMKKEWFESFCLLKFENIEIRVPAFYEDFLSDHYGDWKKIPAVEKRKTHNLYIIDLKKSYKNYVKSKIR